MVPDVGGIASAAKLEGLGLLRKLRERALRGGSADVRAFGRDLRLGDLPKPTAEDLTRGAS